MRFVHTADLHLGRKLAQMSLLSDTAHMLDELATLVEREDAQALVVAGDVFDSPNPPEAAVRQWDRFITRMAGMRVPVLVVSGNHDSGARLAVGSDLIALAGIHLAGELRDELEPVVVDGINFWLIPFVRPADVRAWATSLGLDAGSVINYDTALLFVLDHLREHPAFAERPNVCVAHQFVIASGVKPERSESEQMSLGSLDSVEARDFDGFDYVALGHVHGPQRIGRDEVRYAGSPLKLSSSEIPKHKSYVVVDVLGADAAADAAAGEDKDARVTWRLEPVVPLRDFRQERGSVDELVRRAKQQDQRTREDFVHAIVTDDNPIDVVSRLRREWPNLEQVVFDNAITRAAGVDDVPTEVDLQTSMPDLFREFFERQAGKPLDEEEQRFVDEAFEKVQHGKGGDEE